jgi:outer membrane protein
MELSQKYQDTIAKRQTELETKVQNFQKQKAMMAVDKQQEEEQKLQKEVQDFQAYVTQIQNEVAQAREKLLEPIRTKVKAAIEAVAKEEKLTLVLHKDASMVLYSEPKLDITFRVIDKIKREK